MECSRLDDLLSGFLASVEIGSIINFGRIDSGEGLDVSVAAGAEVVSGDLLLFFNALVEVLGDGGSAVGFEFGSFCTAFLDKLHRHVGETETATFDEALGSADTGTRGGVEAVGTDSPQMSVIVDEDVAFAPHRVEALWSVGDGEIVFVEVRRS